MLKIKFAIGVVALLCSGLSYCQQMPDSTSYIVVGADTLHGFLKYQDLESNPATIKFRSRESADWKEYTPRDVSAFYVFGNMFESKTVEIDFSSTQINDILAHARQNVVLDTLVFLKVELKAKSIALYKYFDGNAQAHYFVSDGATKLQELRKKCMAVETNISCRNDYWQTLRSFLSACPDIDEDDIKRTDLRATDLKRLFKKYYKCTTGNSIEASSAIQGGHDFFSISAYAAPGITRLSFQGQDSGNPYTKLPALVYAQFGNSVSFQAGLTFEHRPRLNPRFAFDLDLGIRHYGASSDVSVPVGTLTYRNKFTFESTYLKLSPSAVYHFRLSGVAPFIKTGFSYNYAASFSSTYVLERTNASGDVTSTSEPGLASNEHTKSEFGIFAGVGVRYAKLTVELRGEQGSGILANYAHYGSKTQSFSLYLAFKVE
jgi:hypothetical protein